jgi:hypothetical protein
MVNGEELLEKFFDPGTRFVLIFTPSGAVAECNDMYCKNLWMIYERIAGPDESRPDHTAEDPFLRHHTNPGILKNCT